MRHRAEQPEQPAKQRRAEQELQREPLEAIQREGQGR